MGFSSIMWYVGLFLILIVIVAGMVTIQQNYQEQHEGMVEAQAEQTLSKEITITSSDYSDGIVTIWVDNDGVAISPDEVDVYLNGEFIARNSSKRNFTITPNTRNPELWDNGEDLKIEIEETFTPGYYPIVISTGKVPEKVNLTVTQQENELLNIQSGQLTPDLGRALTGGELLALNNKLGTNLTLDPATNSSVGLVIENPSYPPIENEEFTIQISYHAPTIEDNLIIQLKDTDRYGQTICSDIFGATTELTEVEIVCTSGLDVIELDNAYLIIDNMNLTEVAWIDYAALDVTYTRLPD